MKLFKIRVLNAALKCVQVGFILRAPCERIILKKFSNGFWFKLLGSRHLKSTACNFLHKSLKFFRDNIQFVMEDGTNSLYSFENLIVLETLMASSQKSV
jgi:hypothetical protein